MKQYFVLEHTTDIRLKLEASSLQELFTAGLEGMNALIKQEIHFTTRNMRANINLSSIDATSLLIDFLSETLTLSHIKKTVFDTITFTTLTDNKIQATLHGEKVESFDEDIKAVTYHEAYVKKNENNNYEALIIFDI